MSEFVLRDARESDDACISKTWLESFAESHDAGPVPMHLYRAAYRPALDWLRARHGSRTIVACSTEDDNLIMGWVCGGPTPRHGLALHYVFVKSWYRKHGIATALIMALGIKPTEPFVHSYRTPVWRELARASRSWGHGKYDPRAARFKVEDPHVPSDSRPAS